MSSLPRWRRPAALLITLPATLLATLLLPLATADAHGFSSTVYAHVSSPASGTVRVDLQLEYDLLVVSVADTQHDDPFFREATPAWEAGDLAGQERALRRHATSVLGYVTSHLTITAGGRPCRPRSHQDLGVVMRDVPYAHVVVDYACPPAEEHVIGSDLFPDDEGYVTGTETVVTYDLDLRTGSAALDAQRRSFSTHQSTAERFWDFFRLGAEHLLGGLDHLLFLVALVAGSRRLREIVLAATTFTVAHSLTFVLAALGLVAVPKAVVEPTIALSIAVVAGWHLWRLWRRRSEATQLRASGGHLSLDRSGWGRLAVVFCFGLVHGLGFAGALGIDAAWSWTLLWSLLVFNLGIEAVQLTLIAGSFPLLVLLRRRSPVAALWLTGTISVIASLVGLAWFVDRIAI